MHALVSVARWFGLLVLGALVPKLLSAVFTTLSSQEEPPADLPVPRSVIAAGGTGDFKPSDLVDDRFRLVRHLGRGKLSEIWEALDLEGEKRVALRLLLKKHLADASLAARFSAAARASSKLWHAGFPPVTYISKTSPQPYYVCEYLEGERLTEYVLKHRGMKAKAEALDGVKRLAESIDKANAIGIIHGGVTPDDVLIEGGRWTLVDLELACQLSDKETPVTFSPSLSFSAPECFEGDNLGFPTDVYNLGRLLQFVYCEGELPTPFSMTSTQVLDRINCSLQLKFVLKKATSLEPQARYQTTKAFIDALDQAKDPEKKQAAVVGVYLQEKEKIARVLLHSALGVSSVMLLTRALMTQLAMSHHSPFGWVQLSDRPVVGAFHGFIGSVVWGSLIPLSFLLIWPLHVRRTAAGPMIALLVGGIAGFAGGALCSYLSVQVTSLTILKNLGWLLPSATDSLRMHQTLYTTRMFWAFPLEGMLTGCGVGLYLSLMMRRLSGPSTQGLDPLPSKMHREDRYPLQAALEFVSRHPLHQLILLFPIAFSWFTAHLLRAHSVDSQHEWHRTLGEGFVQAVGATGLVIGFFYGIVAPSQGSSKYRIWRTPLDVIRKVSALSKRYGG